MSDPIRWGILSTGNIARQFARGLAELPDARLVAVGSRSQEQADAFAEQFDVPRCHGTYEALAEDPDVEIIYVATPHPFHEANTRLCLAAGKAVLCEKPFAMNAAEARRMAADARSRGLFLMEAMWTRFLPATVKIREWVRNGAIGELRMVAADFGFRAAWNPNGRLLNRELGGGALLDVGCYAVSYASMLMQSAPEEIAGFAHIGETGVDEQAGMVLRYSGGRIATLSCAIRTAMRHEARILGAGGRISAEPFWRAQEAVLTVDDEDQRVSLPFRGNGYCHQAAEAMRCLREGETESPIMPLDESIVIMETLDRIRAQWGLQYPADEA